VSDQIVIRGLEVAAVLGVPDAERAAPQRLEVDLVLETDFTDLHDDITKATDYAAVATWVEHECASVSPRLLESLASHLASGLLSAFPRIRAVSIEVRKFILPQTSHVAVRVRRERS
jgi:dihydroneopterin aldolase / 2-amino-4-hydroxy-6-hydroxymethyldihydropteridine diphosphokinase